jgi:hypothetical protein
LAPLEWTADVAKALNAPDIMLLDALFELESEGCSFLGCPTRLCRDTASAEKRNIGFWLA